MQKIKKNIIARVNRRILLITSLKSFLFIFLIERLYNLQITKSEKYKKLAENNRISVSFVIPSRGLIYDRYDRLLADNKEQYQLIFKHEDIEDKFNALNKIFKFIKIDEVRKQSLVKSLVVENIKKPLLIKNNLSWQEVAKISSNITELRGASIEMILVRVYYSMSSSHIIGYVGSPDKATYPKLANVEGTVVGKLGIEKAYDKFLQGKFGIKKEEVNAHGRVINEISRIDGISGNDIRLSISKELQDFSYNRLREKTGSIVIIGLDNNEIISMVSKPAFNSNDFVNELIPKKWQEIKNNELKPLFNRSSMGAYPPGSIFKLIVTIAAFSKEDFNPRKKFFCSGGYKFGNQIFHCWSKNGHGFVNCEEALSVSCDCYFYELSLKVGIDVISKYAFKFGLGKTYLENIYASVEGNIPTKDWKKRKIGESWTKSDTIVAGIGQGFALASPLQLAVMIACVAKDGEIVIPKILKNNSNGNNLKNTKVKDLKPEAIRLIKRGMFKAVNDPKGTAFSSRLNSSFKMCGKTATSQVRRISMKEREEGILKNEDLPREKRDHALFVGYYPSDNPKFAFSVVVEHGGSGSKSAAPIAKDLCKKLEGSLSKYET